MRTFDLTFNRPLAMVILATLLLLVVLTGVLSPNPMRSAFSAEPVTYAASRR